MSYTTTDSARPMWIQTLMRQWDSGTVGRWDDGTMGQWDGADVPWSMRKMDGGPPSGVEWCGVRHSHHSTSTAHVQCDVATAWLRNNTCNAGECTSDGPFSILARVAGLPHRSSLNRLGVGCRNVGQRAELRYERAPDERTGAEPTTATATDVVHPRDPKAYSDGSTISGSTISGSTISRY